MCVQACVWESVAGFLIFRLYMVFLLHFIHGRSTRAIFLFVIFSPYVYVWLATGSWYFLYLCNTLTRGVASTYIYTRASKKSLLPTSYINDNEGKKFISYKFISCASKKSCIFFLLLRHIFMCLKHCEICLMW